ncbi:MAG: hypothetical protein IPM94_00415 [bacterium]|nr:hypothetical protein [bacterium]
MKRSSWYLSAALPLVLATCLLGLGCDTGDLDWGPAELDGGRIQLSGIPAAEWRLMEGEAGTAVTIALSTRPLTNVTVTPSGDPALLARLEFDPDSAVFAGDRLESRTIIVTALDDNTPNDAIGPFKLLFSSESDDGNYEAATETIAVYLYDDDVPGLIVTPSSPQTIAEGDDVPYTVRLQSRPEQTVTVSMTTASGSEDVRADMPAPVTFGPQDWNEVKLMTLETADDAVDQEASLQRRLIISGEYGGHVEYSSRECSLTILDNDCTLQASAGPNGTVAPSGNVIVTQGSSRSFTITPNVGYAVADVLVNGLSVGPLTGYTFDDVQDGGTIHATFATRTFAISATAGPNGSIVPGGIVAVAYGGSQSFSITPQAGYAVENVSVDGVSVGTPRSYTFSNVTANHTIDATFTTQTYTITATAAVNGSIAPSGVVSVNAGGNRTFEITPVTGYAVANVLVDGVSVGSPDSYTFSNVNANHSIHATFMRRTFEISATAGPHGSISPSGSVIVQYGDDRSFTITPNSGSAVEDVLVDNVSVGPVTSYTFQDVSAPHTISATFSLTSPLVGALPISE